MTKRGNIQTISAKEHVEKRPGMYIGPTTPQKISRWIYDGDKIIWRETVSVSGFIKIFDEPLTNSRDHAFLDSTVKNIYVSVDIKTGIIEIKQDGIGIPTDKVEIAFSSLRTSSNYDDTQTRLVGGLNGYGVKLTNIFSKWFEVESSYQKKKVFIRWDNNMNKMSTPIFTKTTASQAKKDGVKIRFLPDYKKFNMKNKLMEFPDTIKLLHKRVLDVAATTNKRTNVYWNGEKVTIRHFKDYVSLYLNNDIEYLYDEPNERWQIAVAFQPDDEFRSISQVNGIDTFIGGEHVNHVTNQIVRKITQLAKDKLGKKDVNIRPSYIKMRLWVFVNALVENPSFSSQTKDVLTSKDFGSKCVVSDEFISKFVKKSGIISYIQKYAQHQADTGLSKTDGKKVNKLRGIPKLEDANKAGTAKSNDATLMVVEGDSAKTLAISGFSVVGRDYYGVYPVRGKMLNVRIASSLKRNENQEIKDLKKILGLKEGEIYKDTSKLRYGKILIMVDQDHDGSHIKGLILNWIHYGWPSLLKIPGFIEYMRTPIIKATKNKKIKSFYTQIAYEKWKKGKDIKKYRIKYYKGLGTSTSAEAKDYFRNLKENKITFINNEKTDKSILLAFDKNEADSRKSWLKKFDASSIPELDVKKQSINKFVHHELIQFSRADIIRSIPSIIDGLKPSQRKVLWTCLHTKVNSEIKVTQLAGRVSEKSAYHHGDDSLKGVIINLAQDFVSSGNNINLLEPKGQFGSRQLAGKDAASPRYIFTKLEKITRLLFHPKDDDILTYLDDDGISIEPEYYIPIIPFVLVNGGEGIGTGFSTNIPPFSPLDIINNLKLMLTGKSPKKMIPWYSGYRGKISVSGDLITFKGVYEKINTSSIIISELPPVGKEKAIQEYKIFLESLIVESSKDKKTQKFIKKIENHSTDRLVLFKVEFVSETILSKLLENEESFLKKMKLMKTSRLSNIHAFDENGVIKKYKSTTDILMSYFPIRLKAYNDRKEYLLKILQNKLVLLINKINFLKDVKEKKIILMNVEESKIIDKLTRRKYSLIDGTYDYLLNMNIRSFTKEKIQKLQNDYNDIRSEKKILENKSSPELWMDDLKLLEKSYVEMMKKRNEADNSDILLNKKILKKTKTKKLTTKHSKNLAKIKSRKNV